MPALHKSIEHVTLTLSAGTNPASVNLTKGQDPAACTQFYSIREAAAVAADNGNILPEVWFDDNAGTARVNAQLLNGDDVQVEIAVVEWDLTKVNVQQGTYTIASGQVLGTAAISAVDQGKAFIVHSERMATSSGLWFDRACHRAKFTSDTEITFSRFTSSTLQTTTGRFTVVECIGTEFSVQFLELSNDASSQGATSYNQAISAVDMAKTFIVGGYTAGNNDDDPVDGAMWWALTSTTNIQFQRLGGGTPAGHFMNTSVFVVTCANDEWTVQRAQPTIASGETADDTTIGAIDQARSVINPGSNMSLTMGHANTTTGGDAPGLLLGFTFAADTTVRASRRITGSLASAYAFETIQFADPNPAVTHTIDASLHGAIQKQRTLAAMLAGALQMQGLTATASASAGIALLQERTADLTASVAAVRTAQANLEAALEAERQIAAGLTAGVQTEGSISADLNAMLAKLGTAEATLSAIVQASLALNAAMSAAVRDTKAVSASLNASITVPGVSSVTATLAAAVQAIRHSTATVNAALQATQDASATLTAAISAARVLSADIGAAVMASRESSATLAGAVQKAASLNAQARAAVAQGRTADAAMSAGLALASQLDASLTAVLRKTVMIVTGANAAVLDTMTTTAALSAMIGAGLMPSLERRRYVVPGGSRGTFTVYPG